MSDKLKEFIGAALCQPSDYVSYFASVKLTEMFPGAAIIENESCAFNLPEYAKAGLCSVWRHGAVHSLSDKAGCQAHVPKPVEPSESATVAASFAGRFENG